jgi:predicted Zn-dependent peptidase
VRGLETLISRGERVQFYNHFLGQPNSFTYDLDLVRNTTPASIQKVAATYLQRNNRVEIVTMPGNPAGKPARVSSAEKGQKP